MENSLVNLNGELLNGNEAKISVFDRSFIYGDSIYEVVRTYQGVPFQLDRHLERLERSARLCSMKLSQSIETYRSEILKTIQAYRSKNQHEVYCRIIVTRGIGTIGFGLSHIKTPTQFVIMTSKVPVYTDQDFEKGLHLGVAKRIRNHPQALDPAMKSGNYLNNLLAYLETVEGKDFDDALICNHEGFITEGTTFNIFYVKEGVVITSPLNIGILEGITRKLVIDRVKELDLSLREVPFPKERLYDADEVFATSSIKEVYPVLKVDHKKIGTGKPGPITRKLKESYQSWVQALHS